jgi:hypothetical protein
MKGKRKKMRKEIRDACDSQTQWIQSVYELEKHGIPHNLIIKEANDYGLYKRSRET